MGANFEKGKGIEQLQADVLYFWPFMLGAMLVLLSMVLCATIQMDNDTKDSINKAINSAQFNTQSLGNTQKIKNGVSILTKYIAESSIKTGRFITTFLVVSGLLFFFGIFQLSFGAINFGKLC